MADDLARKDAAKHYPSEYRAFLDEYEHGEAIFRVHEDDREADRHYRLAIQKGGLLAASLQRMIELQAEEERRKAAERAARAEEERLMREAAEAELRLREEEQLQAAEEAAQAVSRQQKPARERGAVSTVVSYTVRRGETLPQIAGRPEVYNNSSLWPLIYRANRDQIRDPKRLWPGQVLVIPRGNSVR